MTSTYSQQFSAPPSLWGLYPRLIAVRKPALVPEGRTVPRLEARLSQVRVDARHLRRYRELCGAGPVDDPGGALPIAYPHLLASALHLVILGSERFPVAALGLVHVANRIEQFAPLDAAGGGELVCWLQGHDATARGHEFELHTEWRRDGVTLWRECCRFLARRRVQRGEAAASSADVATARPAGPEEGVARATSTDSRAAPAGEGAQDEGQFEAVPLHAPAGLGRRYGTLAGDVNPIHIADLTARAFGFRRAIAHGMWTLARCAAELEPRLPAASGPRVLDVQFRAPVFLPASLALRGAATPGALRFELRDARGARTHLSGSLRRAA